MTTKNPRPIGPGVFCLRFVLLCSGRIHDPPVCYTDAAAGLRKRQERGLP
jgi:hypothetical protein